MMSKIFRSSEAGQSGNGQMLLVAIVTAVCLNAVNFIVNRIWNSPEANAQEIQLVKSDLEKTNTQVATVCTYSTNLADRVDKNLQAIAKAVKAEVVTGNEKDNPCIKK